ncbi:MAG: putative glycoside hydrolase [Butyricicoccus sp.]
MRYPEPNRKKQRRLVVLFVVLILVLAVLMSAFLVLRCLTFDETGAHVKDYYGVLAAEGSSSGLVDYSRYATTEKPDTTEQTEKDSEEEEKTEEPVVSVSAAQPIRAITVDAKQLTYDDDYRGQILSLASQGILDTVIVDLKNSDGYLSEEVESVAVDTSVMVGVYADDFPSAVAALKQAGIRVIGRVYAFRDDMATRQNSDLSCWYAEAGTNWLDTEGRRWLDPTDAMTMQYLCDIVAKGIEIGCDEILLAQFCFPQGQTDLIAFDNEQDYATTIQSDLQMIQNTAGDVPVSLYLEQSQESSAATGMDLSKVYSSLYRIVTPAASFDGLGAYNSGGNVVTPVFTDRDEWSAYSATAVFDTSGDVYTIFYLGT